MFATGHVLGSESLRKVLVIVKMFIYKATRVTHYRIEVTPGHSFEVTGASKEEAAAQVLVRRYCKAQTCL